MSIVIDGKVSVSEPNLAPTIGAFKQLKKDIKSAKDELALLEVGSDAYNKQAAKIGQLTDKVDDLNKSISAVAGEPIQNLNGSFALMSNQLANLDLKGASASFGALFDVIAANPILILVTALTVLIENLDEATKFVNSFSKSFQDNEKAVRSLNIAYSEVSGNLDEIAFRGAELIKNVEFQTKRQIELAKQRGASAAEIDRIELEGATKKFELLKKIEDNYRKQREFAEGQLSKAFNTNNEETIKVAREVFNRADQAYKESRASVKDFDREIQLQILQNRTDAINRFRESEKQKTQEEKEILRDEFEKELEDLKRYNTQYVGIVVEKDSALVTSALATEAELEKIRQKKIKEDLRTAQFEKNLATDISSTTVLASQNLADTLFNIKSNNLKKGSVEEVKYAKQQFAINKALQLSTAVINGAQGVLAITTVPDFTLGVATALRIAGQVALTATTIANIASVQFKAPSAGSDSSSAPSGISVAAPQPVTAQTPIGNAPITGLNAQGQTTGSREVWVSSSRIKDSVNEITVLENRSKF